VKPSYLASSALAALLMPSLAASAAERYPGAPERVAFAISRTTAESRLEQLNADLAEAGYSTVSGLASGFGAEIAVHFDRFRVFVGVDGIFGEREASRGGAALALEHRRLSLGLGYALFRGSHFSLLPRLGLGTTDLLVDVEASQSPLFRAELANAEGRVELAQGLITFDAGVHAEAWVPVLRDSDDHMTLGAFVALNAGYALKLNDPEWRARNLDLGDLGREPVSGADGVYSRFLLGVVFSPSY
jgi:hypothetical protein